MGVVYRAHDPSVGRDVAVKVLHDNLRGQPEAVRRFLDEAQITGRLQHPGVPAVFEIGELQDRSPFLAMKLIEGRTLADLIEGPDPDRGRLLAPFEHICQAVAYAHSKGVIHRDLKPSNVMVGAFGEVQVMDWGLAKALATGPRAAAPAHPGETARLESVIETGRAPDPGALTQAGSVLGTPAFMPPEQAGGAVGRVDERADVFGLGALLCAILTGVPPYRAATAEAVQLMAVRGQTAGAFARLDGCGADPALIALCKRCLAAERADRPSDAGEVARAVADLRAEAEERARRAELNRVRAEGAAAEQRKRRRVQSALAGALGLLLAVGGAFAWWQDRQTAERRATWERNGDAAAALIGQCEEALRADEAGKAGLALEQAERRAAEGGADHLADRLARCRADLEMLRDLDRINELAWSVVGGNYLGRQKAADDLPAAFARFGIAPGVTPPDEAARRVNESLVRDRLLTGLEVWLLWSRSADLLGALRAIDPDGFRCAVREAAAAWDTGRVQKLAGSPEALEQPSWFAAVLGDLRVVAPGRRQQILRDALRRRPGDLGVLMALGALYPEEQAEGAAEREGCYRAALALRPRNVAAWDRLGVALRDKWDPDGAVAASRDAIRLDPEYSRPHHNLGRALWDKGDRDGAIAAFTQAIRLDPTYTAAHNNLGGVLYEQGDLDGAIAKYREAVSLDPKLATIHKNLGLALRRKGDLDGAVAALGEAVRLAPKVPGHQANLRQTGRWRELLPRLPDVAAGRAEPEAPAEAVEFARLCSQPFQGRYALATRLFAGAFAADPTLADDPTAFHRYSAACCAALAAGRGPEMTAIGVEEWGHLTHLAHHWLGAELAARTAQAKDPRAWPVVRASMNFWKRDPELAAVRDPIWLAAMPADEREKWEEFWADVDALRKQLASPPPKP
jgi:predicted ribosomally synthesized peptide with SipW-like signal peptide